MKTIASGTLVLTVVVTFLFAILNVQALATDTFPLDVWEEMTAWERSRIKSHDPDVETHGQPAATRMKRAEMVPLTFPFDVQKELDDLDATNWKRFDSKQTTHHSMNNNRGKTYWLP